MPSAAANQDNLDPLILKVFGKTPENKTCQALGKKIEPASTSTETGQSSQGSDKESPLQKASFSYVDPGLNKLLDLLASGLENKDQPSLRKLFHPRLNVGSSAINGVFGKMKASLGKKVEASVHTLWALYTKDKSADDILCSEEEMTISPQYGYELQFGVWISLLGEKELGKVYATIVPSNGHFYIGAFHFQVWTHKSKNHLDWIAEADKDYEKKDFVSAYIKYDLAKKLIFGNTHFKLQIEDKIQNFLESNLNKNAWETELANIVSPEKIIYATSILTREGAGLKLRFLIPKELSAVDIKKHCKEKYTMLMNKTPWFKNLDGLRCGYNLPHEAKLNKDGFLGSIFVDKYSF